MKVVLCTSTVTYVPHNYDTVLHRLLTAHEEQIVGAVLVRVSLVRVLFGICKLCFAGCPRMGAQIFRNLLDVRRKRKMFRQFGIPFRVTSDPNEDGIIAWLQTLNADLILHMRTRAVFKARLLSAPRFGCVNMHHGLLPCERGIMADLRTLAQGGKTGVSLHHMDRCIDAGAIYAVAPVSVDTKSYLSYLRAIESYEVKMVTDFLETCRKTGALPPSSPNTCGSGVYTREPSCAEIRALIRMGMKL